MELVPIRRDADDYESQYLGFSEITMGYFSRGHISKEEFLTSVLTLEPGLLIEWGHWGWRGRYDRDPNWRKYLMVNPVKPTSRHVVHTYLSGSKYFKRGRPGKRGSYPVTILMIEGSCWSPSLNMTWDGLKWLYHPMSECA